MPKPKVENSEQREFYHPEKKREFLQTITTNVLRAEVTFHSSSSVEYERDKDLSQFTKEEIEAWLNSSCGNKTKTVRPVVYLVKKYLTWCEQRGEIVGCSPDTQICIDTSARLKSVMFASPKHLQSVLDKAFLPVEEETIDCVYRGYIWLIYATMPESEVTDVLVSEVDLDNMVIEHNGRSYEIYRESLPVFRKLVTLETMHVSRKNSTCKNVLPRAKSDYLLRTIQAAHPGPVSIRNIALKIKLDNIGIKTGYRNIRWSGIFYQIFEAERAGFTDSLDVWAEKITRESREYTESQQEEFIQNFRSNRSHLKRDYAMWKKAFEHGAKLPTD